MTPRSPAHVGGLVELLRGHIGSFLCERPSGRGSYLTVPQYKRGARLLLHWWRQAILREEQSAQKLERMILEKMGSTGQ